MSLSDMLNTLLAAVSLVAADKDDYRRREKTADADN